MNYNRGVDESRYRLTGGSMDSVQLAQHLVQMETTNPPGNERRCTKYVGEILADNGFEVSYHEFARKRTSLIARKGAKSDAEPICVTGHIDTVPVNAAQWTRDPFGGEIEDGKLYGRGSSDMKSGVAALVTAAVRIKKTLDGSRGVVLVVTAGEEVGCAGAKYLERHPQTLLGSAGAIVVGEPTSNYPMTGHKGSLKVYAHTQGRAAHGAVPEQGDNAIYKAAHLVQALENWRVDTIRDPIMGGGTLNVGTIEGGTNVNSVPDHAKIGIDIRTVPGMDHYALIEKLRMLVGYAGTLDIYQDENPVWSDIRCEWIQDIYELIEKKSGKKPVPRTMSYFTDAGSLRRAFGFPPTVILGPGEPDMAHESDEYCLVEKITEAEEMYMEIMRAWCER